MNKRGQRIENQMDQGARSERKSARPNPRTRARRRARRERANSSDSSNETFLTATEFPRDNAEQTVMDRVGAILGIDKKETPPVELASFSPDSVAESEVNTEVEDEVESKSEIKEHKAIGAIIEGKVHSGMSVQEVNYYAPAFCDGLSLLFDDCHAASVVPDPWTTDVPLMVSIVQRANNLIAIDSLNENSFEVPLTILRNGITRLDATGEEVRTVLFTFLRWSDIYGAPVQEESDRKSVV